MTAATALRTEISCQHEPFLDQSDRDEKELAALGKKGVLRRRFSPLATLGLSCTLLNTWQGMFLVVNLGLVYGNFAGLIYGYIFSWAGSAAVTATMGEMVSMWPTAGGQYHWTFALAPKRWKKVLSYLTGWQSIIAWQTTTACAAYLLGNCLQGLILHTQSDQTYHSTLILLTIIFIVVLVNLSELFPHVEAGLLILHIALFITVLVTVIVTAPSKRSNLDVWKQFSKMGAIHEGNVENAGLAFLVGLLVPAFAFVGADGAAHLTEEVGNPSLIVPKAMTVSIAIGGLLGFAMLVVILYCLRLPPCDGHWSTCFIIIYNTVQDDVLTPDMMSDMIGIPIQFKLWPNAGRTAISVLVVIAMAYTNLGVIAIASRQLWAFSRDNGMPLASLFSYVHSRHKVPYISLIFTVAVTTLFSQIQLGNMAALRSILSLTVTASLCSYLVPLSLLFYIRIQDPARLVPGPWNLGRWGVLINGFAILWAVLMVFFSFWPPDIPVDVWIMNWNCLLWSGLTMLAVLLWFVYGKRAYTGPVNQTCFSDQVLETGPPVRKNELPGSLCIDATELSGESEAAELPERRGSGQLGGNSQPVRRDGAPPIPERPRRSLYIQPVELPA